MKKGKIFYRIVEKCDYKHRYTNGDIIGIDNRRAYPVGTPWFQIEKHESEGERYSCGSWMTNLLKTYKRRFKTKGEAKAWLAKWSEKE